MIRTLPSSNRSRSIAAFLAGLAALAIVAAPSAARAAGEIIPSLGVAKPVHQGDADAKIYGGLAVRGDITPFLKAEVGAAYRTEDRLAGQVTVRQWPITGSLWLSPIPMIYAGGGVGWYQTTFDYKSSLPIADETKQKFGVHLGGGLEVPVGPSLGIDLNGRYVFLDKDSTPNAQELPPGNWEDPDYWSTSAGLAIRF